VAPVRDRSELVSSSAGLAAAIAVETHGELGEVEPVEARSYWNQVWRRFRRDRVAIASGVFILLLIAVAVVGGPIASRLLGHGPNDIFFDGVDENLLPVGPLTWVQDPLRPGEQTLFVLGADSTLGRDEFLRLLYGARVSLQVAILAVLTTTTIGLLLGAIAGYYRGWIDTVISRVIEVSMAFPALLFIIALAATLGDRLNNVTFGVFDRGVLTLLVVFTLFGWLQTARVVRAQVLSLREKEFVEAARMVGATDWKIVRSHVLPHLVAPVIVFSTINVAGFVLGEAGLSFLGLGIKLPTPSWGNLLATAPEFYTAQPWLMVWPGLAVLLTTLAFNLMGDGLRDAFDPRSSQ
jgi:ABC-type dipeptide/oligopeptide/nickel transport system permease subunit